MHGLVSAACFLAAAAVAAPGPDDDSTPSALITLYVPPQESQGERQLTLRLDVAEAESPCGPDTNVQINGRRLGRDDGGAGSGSFETDEKVSVRANWNFTCIEWDGKPREQFLSLDVDEIDGVAQDGAGFVLRFQQTAPVWISDVEGSASMTRIHNGTPEDDMSWDLPTEGGLEFELAEIDFLRSQVAELEELIADKERHLASEYGWDAKKGFSECDSIKCIFKTAYSHVHDAAKAFYSDWMDLPDEEHHPHGRHGRHGKHRRPHHSPPGWGPPRWGHHHGNHTHGNETHPPPPHHGPPFHPPPFCKCPPPPPRQGFGGHPPPPPFEDRPHHGPPRHDGPHHEWPPHHEEPPHHGGNGHKEDHATEENTVPDPDGFVELELKGTNKEGSGHGPHKVDFGDGPPPPPPEEDEEQPITPPDDNEHGGHHGHDDDHRHPPPPHHGGGPDHDGPDHDHPPPPDHDHGEHGDHRHPPPPPGLKSFLRDPAFAPYKISACVFLVALLLVALHARCTRNRSSSRISRRQRRRAARRSRCQGGLLRRILFWRQNTSSAGESVSMLQDSDGRGRENDGAAESDGDNMSTTMEQEIAQFRAAASVVEDMIAAEEGRAEAGRQIRELAARHRQRDRDSSLSGRTEAAAMGQVNGQEMQQMQQMSGGDGFVTVPLGGSNNAAATARVPTDVQIHLARLPHHPFLGAMPSSAFPSTSPSLSFVTPATSSSSSSGASHHAHSHSGSIELGPLQAVGVPPSPTAAFADLMPGDGDVGFDAQLPAYDFEDGPAGSHMVADGMMFSQDGMGGGYVPGCSSAGGAGSADAFGDSKPAAGPSEGEGA